MDSKSPIVHWDLPYIEEKGSHNFKLDLFRPSNLSPGILVPVVVHVHGGGWQRGDRKHKFYGSPFMGKRFSEEGFVTVVPSYRLAGTAKHPAQVTDISRSLRWVFENVAKFGGDAEMIFLCGHSAGAHIVSLLTLHPEYLRAQNLPRNVIKGVIAISGIYYLRNPMQEITPQNFLASFSSSPSQNGNSSSNLSSAEMSTCQCSWKNSLYHLFYVRPNFGDVPEDLLKASPLYYLHSDSNLAQSLPLVSEASPLLPPHSSSLRHHIPPFFLLNAASDFGLENGAMVFRKSLLAAEVDVIHEIVPGTNHATVTRSDETIRRAVQWLKKRIAQQKPSFVFQHDDQQPLSSSIPPPHTSAISPRQDGADEHSDGGMFEEMMVTSTEHRDQGMSHEGGCFGVEQKP